MPPTIREIAQKFGFSSTGTVRDYLKALEQKGFLKRLGNQSRGLDLANKGIPIISSIAAGQPSFTYEDIEGYVNEDLYLGRLAENDVFALRVKGESMIEAGIMDGDIAIIKKQSSAANGDIVAALISETQEASLKILRYKNSRFFLEPANQNYSAITKEFTIIGKLITIVRKY